jgi:hypothetical protein
MKTYISSVFEGEAPCDHCKQKKDCEQFELACRAFSYYVLHGAFHDYTLRQPTNKMFNKIFKEDDLALKNYLKLKENK